MSRFIYLIPLFPLLGFLFNLTVGVRMLTRRDGHGGEGHTGNGPSPIVGWVACASVALSFLVSVYAAVEAHGAPQLFQRLGRGIITQDLLGRVERAQPEGNKDTGHHGEHDEESSQE